MKASILHESLSKIKSKSSKESLICFSIFIYYILYLGIILKSGYLGDDALNINTGGVKYNNSSVFGLTKTIVKIWINSGRLFPFAFYMYGFFNAISSRIIYKLLIIISIFLNTILFGHYIKRMTKSDRLKYYIILLFPVLLQLTSEFNNSIYAFHMLMQITLMWLFLSLHSIINYIENRKTSRCILSVFFLFIALGTYEIAYTFIAILFLTVYAYTHNIKKTIKILVPHLIVLTIMLSLNMYLRLTATTIGYGGVTVNLNFLKVLITFLKQCSSAIPLARYFATFGKAGYPYTLNEIISRIQILDVVLVILFFFILILIKNSIKSDINILNKGIVLLIALLFFIMPGMLIGISSKYQLELQWGTGHLPSYMQSFGFVLICVVLYIIINKIRLKKVKLTIKILCTLVVIFLIIVNQQVGRISIDNSNAYFRWPRENVESAIKLGILSDVTSEDILLCTTNYTFDAQDSVNYYSLEAKKQILSKSNAEIVNELVARQVDSNTYNMTEDERKYAIYSYADKNFGYVIIGECMEIELNYEKTDIKRISVINPKIYFEGDFKDIDVIGMMATDNIDSYQYNMKPFLLSDMEVLDNGKTNRLYQMNYNGKIDIKSIVTDVNAITLTPITTEKQIYFELGKGFTGIEGVAPYQWMWLSNDSELIVYNYLKENISYHMIYNIYAGYEETSNLELYVNDKLFSKYTVNSMGTTIDNDIELNLGQNIIKFKTDAKRIDAPGDPRELYLRVTDFNFNDVITKIP